MIYGTRPPAEYYLRIQADPEAFQFSRAWTRHLERVRAARGSERPLEAAGEPFAVLGRRERAVEGRFAFPLILGLFADSPAVPPFAAVQVHQEFFAGPNSRYGTIPEFYDELSGGLVQLEGETHEWKRSSLPQDVVAGGSSGLGLSARVGDFIVEVLAQLDIGDVDWGQYDNDGPDGVPNSGDDDGFVDIVAVMHPTKGAECDGARNSNRIWSHRWDLGGWGLQPPTQPDSGFVTSTPAASPDRDFIQVWDYTIQPVYSCDGSSINEIGVFAHELGHGFGLPDLYGTGSGFPAHGGVGYWDLMGTGAWGCQGGEPERPCHLGAWSKSVLGWVEVVEPGGGLDHGLIMLDPVETGGQAYRIEGGDGSGEYFLLESRQRIGFDDHLFEPGLLAWHIDPDLVDQKWSGNAVNADPLHMGVALEQADGLEQLGSDGAGGRGDEGDPFPGSTGNDTFHAGSNPATRSHSNVAMGVTMLDISVAAQQVTLRLLTRYQQLTLRTEGTVGSGGLISVDGAAPPPGGVMLLTSAPFQVHGLEAAPGEPLGEGTRNGFVSWEDGSPRVREFQTGLEDSVLVATYGTTQHLLAIAMTSPVESVEPGSVLLSPGSEDSWFAEGTDVTMTAEARTGFSFREWSGAVSGSQNPSTISLDQPRSVEAAFDLTYGFTDAPTSVGIEAAVPQEIVFEVENANLPVSWFLMGQLPEELALLPDEGRIVGAALETGTFVFEVTATDAIGLTVRAVVSLEVSAPVMGVEDLAGPFLLTGLAPTPLQQVYLDRAGNDNGLYDLGDFRAFLVANPELPMTADQVELVRTLVPIGRVGGREGRRVP